VKDLGCEREKPHIRQRESSASPQDDKVATAYKFVRIGIRGLGTDITEPMGLMCHRAGRQIRAFRWSASRPSLFMGESRNCRSNASAVSPSTWRRFNRAFWG
jgi:hypothetical protein